MKVIISIILFLVLFQGFGQNGNIIGRVYDSDEFGYPGLLIELIKDNKSIHKTITDFDGNFIFENIPLGNYSIHIRSVVTREEVFDHIVVASEKVVCNLTYPKPCMESKKLCPKGHKNNIIPILYGFPNKKMTRKSKNKKVKLGGCSPYCEKWHCQEHDLDF